MNLPSVNNAVGILFLLGLEHDSPVLVIGSTISAWKTCFANVRYESSYSRRIPDLCQYDLIVLHAGDVKKKHVLEESVSALKERLSPLGSLVVVAPNYYSYSNMREVGHGHLTQFIHTIRCGFYSYLKLLDHISFRFVTTYLPLPDCNAPAEIVAMESSLLELSNHYPRVLRWAAKMGFPHLLHDGYIFLCSNHTVSSSSIMKCMSRVIAEYLHLDEADIVYERFDVRMRGILAGFIKEKFTNTRYIVRIVSDNATDLIVRKNHKFLKVMNDELPEKIKTRIPTPLFEFYTRGSHAYLETMIPGVLAWKVNGSSLKRKILNESIGFLLALNSSTRKRVILDDVAWEELFGDEQRRLDSLKDLDSEFKASVHETLSTMQNVFKGSFVHLVCSHGDYGYGNIMVNPLTGELSGVIDWDTCRLADFPGVDYFNLLIQKERIENHADLAGAMHLIVDQLVDGSLFKGFEPFEKECCLDRSHRTFFLYIAVLRYIFRALQYPAIFRKDQQDFKNAFTLLRQRLPLG